MDSGVYANVGDVLLRARQGDIASLGQLLSIYRSQLLQIAVAKFDDRIRARVSPSDIVQETLLEAFRDFHSFRGGVEREFLAWLRRILANNLARAIELHLLTDKRDLRRELPLEAGSNGTRSGSEMRAHLFAANGPSPSSDCQQREQVTEMLDRISQLPSHYREVLVLRHLEGQSFEVIASKLGKSPGAVRMIWLRALESMRSFTST